MRWDALFAELEAEFEAADASEAEAELRDRVRRESARLRLYDRLAPAIGCDVVVSVLGDTVRGRLLEVGPDWLLVDESHGSQALIPLGAVAGVTGLGRWSQSPGTEGKVAARLDLSYALRGIARDRSPVSVRLFDGTEFAGTIDRVGSDFIELAEHSQGELRRASAVTGVRTVPRAALILLRSR